MIKHYLPMALAALAVTSAVPAFAQINTSGIPNIDRSVFNLAEAYPCTVGTYENRLGIAHQCFDFLPSRAQLDLLGWPETDIFAHT